MTTDGTDERDERIRRMSDGFDELSDAEMAALLMDVMAPPVQQRKIPLKVNHRKPLRR